MFHAYSLINVSQLCLDKNNNPPHFIEPSPVLRTWNMAKQNVGLIFRTTYGK
jgi:hypothetical protein